MQLECVAVAGIVYENDVVKVSVCEYPQIFDEDAFFCLDAGLSEKPVVYVTVLWVK